MTSVLMGRSHEERQTHGKEGQRETEAEVGEMHLQGKDCQGLTAANGDQGEARKPGPPEPAAGAWL